MFQSASTFVTAWKLFVTGSDAEASLERFMEAQDSPNFHNMIEPLTPQGAKGHYAHRFLCADICHDL